MSYLLRYGTYTFPATFHPAAVPGSRVVGAEKLPRADGGRVSPSYLDTKRILVRGGLAQGPMDSSDLRARIDALRAALAAQPQNLYLWSDRYYRNVYVGEQPEDYEPTGFGRLASIEIEFVTGDPFQYSTTETTDTWSAIASTGETRAITPGGNAPALPKFAITVAGSGAKTLDWTIHNQTTDEAFTIAGTVTGGDVIDVDCLAQTVVVGAVDKMTLFDGRWPTLAAGVANTLEESYDGAALSQIVTTYRSRWY